MNETHLNLDMSKYSKDREFADPVVRCDSCQKLLYRENLKEDGACSCGSRRVRNVRGFTGEEHADMLIKNVDPAFLALFEGVSDA